ncbi:uncharacterized protein HD556DRAFT_1312894 [Suillus plorans]|uniref:Uncharacterized protein n=1 Tax=Suillus plorans TaxID=116603 RepID=A0A9P7ADN6_9AGAM|nr:uncharacterized protein HD556DRAFT_1312894 [Suillus plorans]KAG1787305.1 hypothetical protein HD556DRAFT_1312894 [Suillus plorans]
MPIWRTRGEPIASTWRHWAHPATALQGVGPTVYTPDASGPVRLLNVPWGFVMIMRPAHELRDRALGPAVFMNVVLQAHPSAAHTGPGPIRFQETRYGLPRAPYRRGPSSATYKEVSAWAHHPIHPTNNEPIALFCLPLWAHQLHPSILVGPAGLHRRPLHTPAVVDLMIGRRFITTTFAGGVFQPSRKLMGPLEIVESSLFLITASPPVNTVYFIQTPVSPLQCFEEYWQWACP